METKEEVQTTINPYVDLLEMHKKKAQQLRFVSISERKLKLKKLKNWILSNSSRVIDALYKDLHKSEAETYLTEIQPVVAEARNAIKNLNRWTRPKRVPTPLSLIGTTSFIHMEPKGACLIIAPWNYPFQLTVLPLVEAMAAGNTAVLKPSELTPYTAQLIDDMIGELFEENEVKVVQGEVQTSQQLLALPFDHIFFTGSPGVGKIVMEAASKHLTSVTLELGGKSPVIVDETANLKDAAEKIAWGSFMNCGQTCIAPDHIYVQASVFEKFTSELKNYIKKEHYNGDSLNGDDYGRIVNERHFNRLSGILEDVVEKGGEILYGGNASMEQKLIEPTIVTNLPESSRAMQEEIFGPILPLISYNTLDEIIEDASKRPKPLALYHFTKSKANTKKLLNGIPAGGVCVNESILHFSNYNLPFGGVNNSGIGKSHGYHGFVAFSNEKPVLRQRIGLTAIKFLYPPYTDLKRKMAEIVAKYF